jgi:Histidine kinase-, DNA gyrase B-, and HSP90-like ATPase
MREVLCTPSAPAMMGSLRALGYSFEAALADIVDNSVAAGASRVDIQFRTQPRLYVAIIDDGCGMAEDELFRAMRHGGVGPTQQRSERDLGRFGLGLKTASLAQCRRLTVVTLRDGRMNGAVWDLDTVDAREDWILGLLSPDEIAGVPHVSDLFAIGHGTVVLWENLDKATAGETSEERALGSLIDQARTHLGLVFHRYLADDEPLGRISLAINNAPISPADPFLRSNRATQPLPRESLSVHGGMVSVQPYILPHLSKMTREQLALAGGEEGLRRHQGFYVYRNRRLITYGTWFRLLRQEELTKLARVQVDIPNSLDHLWALDVRKSIAHPPEAVRTELARVVERIAGTSREVYRFRGRRSSPGQVTEVWRRLQVRDGIDYRLNRDHPLVAGLRDTLEDAGKRQLEETLRVIELAIPVDTLYADMASERRVQPPPDPEEIERTLGDLASRMVAAIRDDQPAVSRLLANLAHIEPFSLHPLVTRKVVQRLDSGQ